MDIGVVLHDGQEMSNGQLRQFRVLPRGNCTQGHLSRGATRPRDVRAETRTSNRFKHHTIAATLSW